ncbi:uncharacterized protein LAESUDRAFT_657674 [Laetiporus sulphureus 93-53]|uniref:Uncharacterized protein n=1 Tax=Laetiporus sulphureus 93-53 TaxID=1314785 RepID=A0A165DDU0_9APHY|nr:uncharacterized protein LAESUDRAFT_657674 [Laetiporus sulphureus 93-53]KZT04660.1 hypothetical protein LAESUDRAFT_657674 [Laetiporus sulphureus 93-53]
MGRSAKLHKRSQKKSSTGSASGPRAPSTKQAAIAVSVQGQKKRSVAKVKVFKNRGRDAEGPVLGGADYVDLMLGSRRKAREEAGKLREE